VVTPNGGVTDLDPEGALPVVNPVPMHSMPFDDHEIVILCPILTDDGLAEIVAFTPIGFTVTDVLAVVTGPPASQATE
jgi:hypothetical protein